MPADLELDMNALSEFCHENGIAKLCLFGSTLTGESTPQSDVDLLVEFVGGVRISLLDMVRIEEQLSKLIGKTIDLRTAAELSRYFRDEVVSSARVLYAA